MRRRIGVPIAAARRVVIRPVAAATVRVGALVARAVAIRRVTIAAGGSARGITATTVRVGALVTRAVAIRRGTVAAGGSARGIAAGEPRVTPGAVRVGASLARGAVGVVVISVVPARRGSVAVAVIGVAGSAEGLRARVAA